MAKESPANLRERVFRAAEAVLDRSGSVGPLELFLEMGLLPPTHFEAWRKGLEECRVLRERIQAGSAKIDGTVQFFLEWVKDRGLQSLEAPYTRRSPRGLEPLQVTADGDPEQEKFYRTHYAARDLPGRKAKQLRAKLNKAPDLVVFEKVSADGRCSECGAELEKGSYLFMEKGQPLCLACADLDRLVFLPAGDTALSRRSRKHSPLSAVVVRFNRARNRYERQGLLITAEALTRAEEECVADAAERAAARARAVVERAADDREFVEAMAGVILREYPACPRDEAARIAAHTAKRGSGRVGRSAAGRALDPEAIKLAVVAHVRHEHTCYDALLMGGVERLEARQQVREKIDAVLAGWRGGR